MITSCHYEWNASLLTYKKSGHIKKKETHSQMITQIDNSNDYN